MPKSPSPDRASIIAAVRESNRQHRRQGGTPAPRPVRYRITPVDDVTYSGPTFGEVLRVAVGWQTPAYRGLTLVYRPASIR